MTSKINNPADIQILNPAQALKRQRDRNSPWWYNYLAMYSSIWGGIITDQWLMSLPLDDHMVHRGDGVFDFCKCVGGGIYQFEAHLDRLQRSAEAIYLPLPADFEKIYDIVAAVVKAGGRRDCGVRIFASRGPGGFSADVTECPATQLYVVATLPRIPPPEQFETGIAVAISRVPIKPGSFANIKSCNYLPNVLVKREATIRQAHYGLTLDEEGNLAEGATESLGLVTPDGRLMLPPEDRVLPGITSARIKVLAQGLVGDLLSAVEVGKFGPEDAYSAREVMLFGTSIDVLPVTTIDGRMVADGRPGPVSRALLEMLRRDMTENDEMVTMV